MICFPNAKINLGLHVVSRRPDGYHNIETVFYPLPLYDALEVVPCGSGEPAFVATGIPIDGSPDANLVMKALRLLQADFRLPAMSVYLRKKIPAGAGLGGGSADAAFMLRLVNEFAGLKLSVGRLEEYAGLLGADCPFFIRNTPAFAEGVGNILTPVAVSLHGYRIVVVKPDIHVSTREAYAGITPRQPLFHPADTAMLPVSEWRHRMTNDFEKILFARYPVIAAIKQALYDRGAVYASMSGSGSAVFGIFK
jgi:4-diphosphocytidyl-2-C-methyl-D-erythritol kinase